MRAPGEAGARDDRAQYLHQFVLHAALDAVEEQQWQTTSMSLGVVDKFNNLQARACAWPRCPHAQLAGTLRTGALQPCMLWLDQCGPAAFNNSFRLGGLP